MFECSEEMYEAFKKSLTESSDSETQRDAYMNAIEAAVAASKTDVPPAGEVEVLGYSVKGNRYAIRLTKAELLELYEGYTGDALVELVDRSYVNRLQAENAALRQRLNVADQRVDEMETMLNTPHTAEWFEGVRLEAGHQIGRWGTEHDSGKEPADWFWLIGYLAQKAMTAQMSGDEEKARHHTISTGAAMLNWFRAIVGDSNAMRPGIDAHQSAPVCEQEFSTPDCPDCACVQDGQCLCAPSKPAAKGESGD